MRRIQPVIIAAIGAGLIGTQVMIAGLFEIRNCFERQSLEQCLRINVDGLLVLAIVFICAGIGGALSARFFGRKTTMIWARLGFGLLGAILSTLCGGILAGMGFWVFVRFPFDNIFINGVFGGFYSFAFAFGSWFGVFVWVGGFTLLELTMRKRRRLQEIATN